MPFPAFRGVVGGTGYRELGEPFDDREHKLFGKEGSSPSSATWRAFGMHVLPRFTPA
jgi:hypothetical protein